MNSVDTERTAGSESNVPGGAFVYFGRAATFVTIPNHKRDPQEPPKMEAHFIRQMYNPSKITIHYIVVVPDPKGSDSFLVGTTNDCDLPKVTSMTPEWVELYSHLGPGARKVDEYYKAVECPTQVGRAGLRAMLRTMFGENADSVLNEIAPAGRGATSQAAATSLPAAHQP